jgi:fatty acid desaturase
MRKPPLTPEEVRRLSRVSPWVSSAAIAFDWAFIAALFAVAIRFPHWWVYLACMALMARVQLALAVLMHDAAHSRLFEDRDWNDRVGQLLCAGPVLLPLDTYRDSHLKHHQDPLVPGDPDVILTGGYPVPRRKLVERLVQDMSGLSYLKFLKFFFYLSKRRRRRLRHAPQQSRLDMRFVQFSLIAPNLVIFLGAALAGHPLLYVLLWAVPYMTFLQAYLRIRGLAEHAGYQPGPDQAKNSRTVVSWQAFFVAPHNVNYHVEHHLYPSIPFFRLPDAHELFKKRGAIPPENYFESYVAVLASLVRG